MRRPKKERRGLVPVTDLLEGALQQLGVKGDIEQARLELKCREFLGEKISQALVRVRFKGSKATLEFRHSIWLNEMNFQKAELLEKLQKEFPKSGLEQLEVTLAKAVTTNHE